MRRALRAGAALAAMAAAIASTAPAPATTLDLLDRPAPATARGERRLLLDVTPGGPGLVAVGEMGLLLGSADGGRAWHQLPGPSAVMLTSVHFPQPTLGWAVGHDGVILATTDGGRSWRRQFDGHQANQAMLAAAREELAAAQAAQAGTPRPADAATRLLQAEDQLAAAEDAMRAGPSRPLLAVRFADARRGLAAGAFGQLFATGDGGATWRYIGQRLPNPEGLHLNGLALGEQGGIYIAAEQGVVFASGDGGATWRRGETGYAGHLYGVLPQPGAEDTLLAYGFNGHLFRSTDRGQTWAALPRAPQAKTWVQARARQGQAWLLAEDGRLHVLPFANGSAANTTTKDDTPRPIGPGPLAERRFAGFAFSPDGRALVAVGQGGAGRHLLEGNP